jgi:hypothetical protein
MLRNQKITPDRVQLAARTLSRACVLSVACPLYPQKQTSEAMIGMSAKGQKRTSESSGCSGPAPTRWGTVQR